MDDKSLRRQVNLTCALYAALTMACLAVLQNFSWAPARRYRSTRSDGRCRGS
ncbi:MAG: hypothetical protein IJ111_05170 [Eggerthellaceae bacterium]|nr:hypothetical protein [Eggerthellaceae bacterium]